MSQSQVQISNPARTADCFSVDSCGVSNQLQWRALHHCIMTTRVSTVPLAAMPGSQEKGVGAKHLCHQALSILLVGTAVMTVFLNGGGLTYRALIGTWANETTVTIEAH